MIQRHGQVGVTTRHIRRRFVKKALPTDDHPHFLLFAHKLAEALRHTIFVDQVGLGLFFLHLPSADIEIGDIPVSET